MAESRKEVTPLVTNTFFTHSTEDSLHLYLVNSKMHTYREGSLLKDALLLLDLLQQKADAVTAEKDMARPRPGDKGYAQFLKTHIVTINIANTGMTQPRFFAATELVKYILEAIYHKINEIYLSIQTGNEVFIVNTEHTQQAIGAAGGHQQLPAPILRIMFTEAKLSLIVRINAMFAKWECEEPSNPATLSKRFATQEAYLDCNNTLMSLIEACKELDAEHLIIYVLNVKDRVLKIDKGMLDHAKTLLMDGAPPAQQLRM